MFFFFDKYNWDTTKTKLDNDILRLVLKCCSAQTKHSNIVIYIHKTNETRNDQKFCFKIIQKDIYTFNLNKILFNFFDQS